MASKDLDYTWVKMVSVGWFVLVGKRGCELSGWSGKRQMITLTRSITVIHGACSLEIFVC